MKFALAVSIVGLTAGIAQAQGYRRTTSPGGACLYLGARTFTYDVAPGASGDAGLEAIDRAFSSWNAAADACSELRFVRGQRVTSPRVESTPRANVILFRQTLCSAVVPANHPCNLAGSCANDFDCWAASSGTIAVPTVTYDTATGEIFDVDIELNAASFLFTTVDAPPCQPPNFNSGCVATDVQNTVTAMVGHAIGLDSFGTGTLQPSAPPGETSKRVIDPGTASGLCAIYPRGAPATQCDGSPVRPRPDAGAAGSSDAGPDAGAAAGGQDAGATALCSPATCGGCCTPEGRCESGTTAALCGGGGASCSVCSAEQQCEQSHCAAPRGCGCSAGEACLALLAPLLALRGRRPRALTQRLSV